MEVLSNIIVFFLSIPTEFYAYAIGGLGVSVFTQFSKKLLAIENDKRVILLFTAIAFLFSGVEYLATTATLPPTILGVSTVALMGIATPLYHFVVKPVSNFFAAVRLYRSQVESKASEVKAAIMATESVAVINGGQPVAFTGPQTVVPTANYVAPEPVNPIVVPAGNWDNTPVPPAMQVERVVPESRPTDTTPQVIEADF